MLSKALVVVAAVAVVAALATPHDSTSMDLFNAWRAKYNKSYPTTAAFDHAFHNFQQTLRRVELKNLAQSKAHFDTTKFADLSVEEFRQKYLNLDGAALRQELKSKNLKVTPPQPLSGPIPADFDWAQQNPSPVTYPKDQGQCGSCWAFSVTENVESQLFLAGKMPNGLTDLSEQQIVDCSTNATNPGWPNDGCNGGFTQGALEYVAAYGLESESTYPYLSGDDGAWGPCTYQKSQVVANIDSWEYAIPTCDDACTKQNTTLLMQQLVAIGPFSICVVATDDWQDYSWGVLIGYCPMDAADINHGVQLTGYANGKNEGWWVVRNSWGDDWGNNGYIWVSMPNDCGVADIVTYAVVKK